MVCITVIDKTQGNTITFTVYHIKGVKWGDYNAVEGPATNKARKKKATSIGECMLAAGFEDFQTIHWYLKPPEQCLYKS